MKNKLMNTPQAANVYYAPASMKPLLPRRSRNIEGKTLPSIPIESFAQKTPTKNEFSPERKQLHSKLSQMKSEFSNEQIEARKFNPSPVNSTFLKTATN